jgi:hypothetical protein
MTSLHFFLLVSLKENVQVTISLFVKGCGSCALLKIFDKSLIISAECSPYKNTNHQQMHKESFIINCNTLVHVSTLLGHLQGELFCYRYTKVALYS